MPSGRRHYRVTRSDLEGAHDLALTFGGVPGVLNEGLLLSAIGRPYSGYYRPITRKAAALLESLARNHGYVDGNKRTALIMVWILLTRSRYTLQPASADESVQAAFEDLVVTVADGRLTFDQIDAWFRARVVRP